MLALKPARSSSKGWSGWKINIQAPLSPISSQTPPNGEQETTVPLPGGGGQRESHLPPSSPAVSVDESLRTTGSIDCLPYDGDDSSVENWNSGFKDRVAAASRPGGGASGGGEGQVVWIGGWYSVLTVAGHR